MKGEIINKVANREIITINLEDYFPKKSINEIDIKSFLYGGSVLKEKDFRKTLKELDFSIYGDSIVCLFCSSDAIIPMWAYMLVSSYLISHNYTFYFGKKNDVIQRIALSKINDLNTTEFKNKKVIVKGCSNEPLSAHLYVAITQKLQTSVRSLMFGEACSAVPVYKNKKNES